MSPLGIPPGSAKSAIKAVRSHLEAAGRQAEFEAAIDALAGMPGSTATRTGYGEHLFAPAVMTDPTAPRNQRPGGRDRLKYIDLRWPHLAAGTRGHYSELRQCLNDYADQLTAGIDSNPSWTIP